MRLPSYDDVIRDERRIRMRKFTHRPSVDGRCRPDCGICDAELARLNR
jgi:hypothetical protein